jgi:hypothetical protein
MSSGHSFMFARSRQKFDRVQTMMLAVSFALLFAIRLSAQVESSDAALAVFTRAQMNSAILQTKNPSTRLEGLHQLIRMAGPRLYEGSIVMGDPNPEMFKLRGEAAQAVASCRDVATISEALDSRVPSIRTWAVLNFERRPELQGPWLPLLPRLVRLLSDPDPGMRQMAVDALWFLPEGRRAILEREPLEMDPYVLLRIARSGSSPAFKLSLLRLLSSPDAGVRGSALSFIYFNLSTLGPCGGWDSIRRFGSACSCFQLHGYLRSERAH